jgi:hypothetical protein
MREYRLMKFNFDPSRVLGSCVVQIKYFTSTGYESSLQMDSDIDVSGIKEVLKIRVNTKTLLTHLRTWGYLVEYNTPDFNDVKGLFFTCPELRLAGGFHPNFMEDVQVGEAITLSGASAAR